jgi:hypothetical protein
MGHGRWPIAGPGSRHDCHASELPQGGIRPRERLNGTSFALCYSARVNSAARSVKGVGPSDEM